MSQISPKDQDSQVQFIYDGQNYQEYILDSDLNQLICDGSRAILVDGQYLLADNQTILLQSDENFTQYYIDDDTSFVIDENTNLFDSTECLQLVEDESNETSEQQIICYSNEDSNEFFVPNNESNEESIGEVQDEEGNVYPFKRIKVEGQMLNLEEFMQQNDKSSQFELSNEKADKEDVDITKITGRNLITGQTVTLETYMEKLKNRMNKASTKRGLKRSHDKTVVSPPTKNELTHLLDKKISIGKTRTGKKIIGKIIHVEKKTKEAKSDNNDSKIVIRKSTVTAECLEQICKTLSGVMEMESVKKRLENKNLIVKFVEKKYQSGSESYKKTLSHCYGHMECAVNEETGDRWKFIKEDEEEEENSEAKPMLYPTTTNLTILVTYEKDGTRSVKVNLNPNSAHICPICTLNCKTFFHLRQHLTQIHKTALSKAEESPFSCSWCEKSFDNSTKCQKHEITHSIVLQCEVCDQNFDSKFALRKHSMTHLSGKFVCEFCSQCFSSKYELAMHKKTHFSASKTFECGVCSRTFSRHSNLLRHSEIHMGAGALYKCEICSCAYNYMSSLTRHKVQSHLDADAIEKQFDE